MTGAMDERPAPSDQIRTVARAVHLLEVVGQAPTGLPVKEIARRCGFTVGTTYHLVRTLTFDGFLLRWKPTTYTLGFTILARARELSTQLGNLAHDDASTAKLAKLLGRSPDQVANLLAQATALDSATDRQIGPVSEAG